MELRHLTLWDTEQALLAHKELSVERFDFLLGYDAGMDWTQFLQNVEDTRRGHHLPRGHVPATFLVAEVEGNLVGRVSVRHRLNPSLRIVGGHIGYAVRPQFRGRGYAQQILQRSLTIAKHLGIDRVLVTCDADNHASRATIERCGGALEAAQPPDAPVKLRYWINNEEESR